jgi:hypothetical protein
MSFEGGRRTGRKEDANGPWTAWSGGVESFIDLTGGEEMVAVPEEVSRPDAEGPHLRLDLHELRRLEHHRRERRGDHGTVRSHCPDVEGRALRPALEGGYIAPVRWVSNNGRSVDTSARADEDAGAPGDERLGRAPLVRPQLPLRRAPVDEGERPGPADRPVHGLDLRADPRQEPLEDDPAAAREEEVLPLVQHQAELPRGLPRPEAHVRLLPELRVVHLERLPDLPEGEPGVLGRALAQAEVGVDDDLQLDHAGR